RARRTPFFAPDRPLRRKTPARRRAAARSWRLLDVPAELEAHRREHAVLEFGLAARAEALEQRRGEHMRGNAGIDRRIERPPSLAGVRYAPGELRERRIGEERAGGEVEQPRRDHAPAPPDLGDLGKVEVVLVELRVAQRGGF